MTELARTEYGYDRNSNRTWRNSPGTDQDEFYTYDDVNRLESRDQGTLNAGKTAISGTPVEEEVFDLDATANVENYLLKENGTTQLNQSRTFAANNENVLIAGSGTNVAFDANGNMTTLPVVGDFSSNWTAAYDAWNRLVRINSGGSPLEDYLYDGLNRRVQKDDGSVRDFYYSDEWQIVEERIANATPADKTHVWGLRYIDDLAWIDDGATRQYALHDYYSIIAVTNTSGVVQQRYGFSAYGERRVLNASYVQTSSSATDDVGYGGYYEDAGTKMYQVRNRFLHPGLGRWINRDPIGYGGGNNLYGYVNGNPVNGVDYFGLECDAHDVREHVWAYQRCMQKAASRRAKCEAVKRGIDSGVHSIILGWGLVYIGWVIPGGKSAIGAIAGGAAGIHGVPYYDDLCRSTNDACFKDTEQMEWNCVNTLAADISQDCPEIPLPPPIQPDRPFY